MFPVWRLSSYIYGARFITPIRNLSYKQLSLAQLSGLPSLLTVDDVHYPNQNFDSLNAFDEISCIFSKGYGKYTLGMIQSIYVCVLPVGICGFIHITRLLTVLAQRLHCHAWRHCSTLSSGFIFRKPTLVTLPWMPLTLTLLTWRKWWAPNNASKWQMGFNSAFKVLNDTQFMPKKSNLNFRMNSYRNNHQDATV